MTLRRATRLHLLALLLAACSSSHDTGADGGVVEPAVHPAIDVTVSYAGDGVNSQETYLNVDTVRGSTFGKLFTREVDGDMYAQPLYASGLVMGDGTKHDVVFVATEHDSVFAFDADDPASSAPLWQRSLGTSTPLPSPNLAWEWAGTPHRCGPFNMREVGITSTPVIDLATHTLYVVDLDVDATHATPGGTCLDVTPGDASYCKTVTCDAPKVAYWLHALDLVTGADKLGGPVEVTGSVPGTGDGSDDGTLTFDAAQHLQRPSLLLANGDVYFATSSFSDAGVYHGWIFAYDAATLKPAGLRNVTRNGEHGGIWQSGHGAIADADGNVYLVTGQGTFDGNTGGDDWGDTFLKLSPDLSEVRDYFTQYFSDYQGYNFPSNWDADLGSAGPTRIPGTTMALVAGKMGFGYLVDTANMGKWSSGVDHVVQTARLSWPVNVHTCGSPSAPIFGTPVAWAGPDGTHVFVWANQDSLREFLLDGNGKFDVGSGACFCDPWVARGTDDSVTLPPMPPCAKTHSEGAFAGTVFSAGGALAVSSYGKEAGTGVLWATYADPKSTYNGGNAANFIQPGILAAYDATSVTKPLWTSGDDAARDGLGDWAKFTPPTVANGKVYVATFSDQLVAYGLLSR